MNRRPSSGPSPRILRRIALLGALAGGLLAPGLAVEARAQADSGETAVRQVAHRLHDALARGDSAAVLELLSEEVTVYESGHAETRSEYRAGHLAIDIEFAGAVEREVLAERVRAGREGLALYTSEYRARGTFRGEDVDAHGTETLVMERRPEGWRVVHVHWSSR